MQCNNSHTGNFSLKLLDSAQTQAVQMWEFKDRNSVKIGRGTDNQITLADPQISRLHVELIFDGQRWKLVSHGRNGTRVNGYGVSDFPLQDGSIFQLGTSGPSFQFHSLNQSSSHMATIENVETELMDFLVIDEKQKSDQVQQIIDGTAFQQLQEQARRLRENRNSK